MDASKIQKTSYINRIPQLSEMRAAACIAIVVLHTVFAANEYFHESVSAAENLVSRIVENNMMWAVPLFVMVTGVLQLDYNKPLSMRKLYGKYILRIFSALLVFSVLFRVFDIIMDHEALTLMNLLKAFTEMITAKGWGHLWYLYLLIGLYIMLPFYRKIVEYSSERELKYLVCVYVVFLSVIKMIESFGFHIGFYISDSLIYLLYLILGYMIYNKILKVTGRTGLALFALSTITILALDIAKYRYGAAIPSDLFGYSSPAVIAQSIGIFAIINDSERTGSNKVIYSIDACAFGIYLIHMVFVRALFRYIKFNPYDSVPALSILLCVIGFSVLSYIATYCLKKMPLFRGFL